MTSSRNIKSCWRPSDGGYSQGKIDPHTGAHATDGSTLHPGRTCGDDGNTPLSIKAMLTRLRDEGFRVRSIRVYEVIEVPDHPLVDSEVEVPVQVDHDSLMPIGVESGF